MSINTPSTTPLMQQYFEIKKDFTDAFVFFQVGDFYELFFEDAQKAALILGITLTKRGTHQGNDIPLCGVPMHTISHYYLKLIKEGHRVVLCNQIEAAQPGKLVQRAVSQIITAATMINEQGLDAKQPALLVCLDADETCITIAIAEFLIQQVTIARIEKSPTCIVTLIAELERMRPQEIIAPEELDKNIMQLLTKSGYKITLFNKKHIYHIDAWMLQRTIEKKYHIALALFLSYMSNYYPDTVNHFQCTIYYPEHFLQLDAASQNHLELLANKIDGSTTGTLYDILHHTVTSMGSRLLRSWIVYPLKNHITISERHDAIEALLDAWHITRQLIECLKEIGDIERIAGRIRLQRASYNDFKRINQSLKAINAFKDVAQSINNSLLQSYLNTIKNFSSIIALFDHYVATENFSDAYKIRPEADNELKKLFTYMHSSTETLLAYEHNEQVRSGISSLKVRSTPMYGYVLEITKAHAQAIPSEYVRVQTLTNRERYSHAKLKTIEYEIINAKEKYQQRDNELFAMIVDEVYQESTSILAAARALAAYDVLISYAKASQRYNYTRPLIDLTTSECTIINGKHPVIAAQLGHTYTPNSLALSSQLRTWVITGPNMGGKSTFMRQCALIVIMTQIGCFVPAEFAKLPLFDSLFTRIGATDYVIKGKSTFYVEMEESALICALACKNSLVLLDEIGRGTSTYDGMSLAHAIIHYLHEDKKPFMLCATHYHELHDLLVSIAGIDWYYAATEKNMSTGEITLLHTLRKGHVKESMGIEVARNVGLPEKIITMATKTKHMLEKQ